MHKEYFLLGNRKTVGSKIGYHVIDRVSALGKREAVKDLMARNDFKKLLVKNDLIVVRVENYYQ